MLRSPDIWPTKEELKGELSPEPVLEAPTGREDYSSAETHADDIRATFVEEMAMDMVLGPFTAAEAASRCNCLVSELCPGPNAAIDEEDKIRTMGKSQCPHTVKLCGAHYGPHGDGLYAWHSLASGYSD